LTRLILHIEPLRLPARFMNQGFYNWGLPVGRLFGIRIRLHFLLLIFFAFSIGQYLEAYHFDKRLGFIVWGIATFLLFLIVFLHELGHCFAARKVGGSADDVLLWPLGGLAFTQYPQTWRNTLIVVAGGPMVNVLIAVIAIPSFLIAESANPSLAAPSVDNYYYYAARTILYEWNLVMLVFNLLPLFPLDGGQLFRAIMWGRFEKKGGIGDGPYFRASTITVPVSMTIGAIGVLFSVYKLSDPHWDYGLFPALIFAWAMFNTWQLKKQLESMSSMTIDHGNEFGYDFSEGNTSLANSFGTAAQGEKKPGIRQRRKDERQRQSKQDDEKRMDALFNKINDEGLDSLSKPERKFLEEMSRRMQ
jgi:stage IV sporulation protein FB